MLFRENKVWKLIVDGENLVVNCEKGKSQQYCEPNSPTTSIFYGIWIMQSGAMGFILNLDKLLIKKLFPTMNI